MSTPADDVMSSEARRTNVLLRTPIVYFRRPTDAPFSDANTRFSSLLLSCPGRGGPISTRTSLRPQPRAIESEFLIGKSHPQSTRGHPIERLAAGFTGDQGGTLISKYHQSTRN